SAGLRVFGENRVQEAQPKIGELPADIEWHFIGHLQSNKAKACADLFDMVHSVDSLRLGKRLAARAAEGRSVRMLLQVNLTGKASQSGFTATAVHEAVTVLAGEPGAALEGLMTIAPQATDDEESRPWFRRLARLHRELGEEATGHPWRHLSMGMTEDYLIAIEEGATLVRVGRALFGERPT
ncbi:MAG: YggS family pyridoxal phosphate-dependent enzyme, partial [Dehalococcoidia bacterium]|nr:YggS family pyridoxal phosphate-dependent enzyme [Dehalococcoidia bacterium]